LAELNYGGQAVIEGVMMRGAKAMAVAVRQPDGEIALHTEMLDPKIYASWVSRVPFLRALTSLWDVLVLGIRTLLYSAEASMGQAAQVQFNGPIAWGTVAFSLALGVGLFFVVPLLIIGTVDRFIESSFLSNVIEGLIRMAIFLGYLVGIGRIPEIRRVFSYHGAEHKTVNAYEAGLELTPEKVSQCSTSHFRCGTAFLLSVMVISILIFALLGRPPMALRILSRIVLIPVVAGIAYEYIKFTNRYRSNRLVRAIAAPNLALQKLTTREPDLSMLEVSIAAFRRMLEAEQPASEPALLEPEVAAASS